MGEHFQEDYQFKIGHKDFEPIKVTEDTILSADPIYIPPSQIMGRRNSFLGTDPGSSISRISRKQGKIVNQKYK